MAAQIGKSEDDEELDERSDGVARRLRQAEEGGNVGRSPLRPLSAHLRGGSTIADVIRVGRLLSIGTVGTRLLRGRRLDVI